MNRRDLLDGPQQKIIIKDKMYVTLINIGQLFFLRFILYTLMLIFVAVRGVVITEL